MINTASMTDYYNAPTRPSLCVVICVHNAPDYSEMCIESVLQHTPMPYDLVIIDDGSKQVTTKMIKEFVADYDHIRTIRHEKARGYTCAANAGLKASSADFTVLLNSDTLVSPYWSEQLIDCALSSNTIGIVGPLSNAATYQSVPFVFDENGRWKQNELPENLSVPEYARAISEASLRSYPRMPVTNGFCFCIKRSVIDEIGYLDEETFPQGYGEENDYCLRASDAGFEIAIADDTYVYHATSKSFGVEKREKLTDQAHSAIRSKYSQDRLDDLDKALRSHEGMELVRENIVRRVYHALSYNPDSRERVSNLPKENQDKRILFLLPGCGAKAGGTQVIVETARGLSELNVPVAIATTKNMKKEYEAFFPRDAHLFFYYENNSELYAKAEEYNVAVATIYHTVELLQKIMKRHHHVQPAYYIQDYEPWFLNEHPDLQDLATRSYTMIDSNIMFALSPWVQGIIKDKHGGAVHKIDACFDQSLFYPDYGYVPDEAHVTITAMIRPTTLWRAPDRTMRVLKALKDKHGEAINIQIFGCTDHEIEYYELENRFDFDNYMFLGRIEVAKLLRNTDVFLDLSDFQAFGRTGLEAMACGCSVVLPEKGGVRDYATHGTNALIINSDDEKACVSAASRLIENKDLRDSFRQKGIETGLRYSIARSAQSLLKLLHQS